MALHGSELQGMRLFSKKKQEEDDDKPSQPPKETPAGDTNATQTLQQPPSMGTNLEGQSTTQEPPKQVTKAPSPAKKPAR